MDSNEQLPIDMLEQLLKFVPSTEEQALLDKHSEDSLARADKFVYEISKIPRYDQRLKSLCYKKRFTLIVNDLSFRIASVLKASREVVDSKRLRKLLELVLAFGNYMNQGTSGKAFGFRLASLNRLADTKSSSRKGITLLHYLIQVVEKQESDLLKLEEDIPHVRVACKVLLSEIDKDITALRTGLADILREIHQVADDDQPQSDQFLPVMSESQAQASIRFKELEEQFQVMRTKLDEAIRLFREDELIAKPNEFFGIFDKFLTAFVKARQDNEEKEGKCAKKEAKHKKQTKERKNNGFMSTVAKTLRLKSDSTNAT